MHATARLESMGEFRRSADFSAWTPRLLPRVPSDGERGGGDIRLKLLRARTLSRRNALMCAQPSMAIRLQCGVYDPTYSMKFSDQFLSQSDLLSAPGEPEPCSCGVAPEGRTGGAFNEEMFHHFLAIETKRSERSNRPFLLLLIDLKQEPGRDTNIDSTVAARLFEGLSQCLRETDVVGWYLEQQIVGAVLTQFEGVSGTEFAQVVRQRLRTVMRATVASDPFRRLQLRVSQRPSDLKGRS
jgi:hypothetical protein